MSRTTCIMLVGMPALLASPVVAKTIDVGPGGDYTKVQAAIDAAVDGDEIVVAQGTYSENISFGGKKITVRSTHPKTAAVVAATILDGHQAGSVVTFNQGETSQSIIEGLTITGGTGTSAWGGSEGGGIYCYGASPTIRNNTVSGNSATQYGGGIYCDKGSPIIRDNTLTGNSTVIGGGIFCYQDSSPTILNNTVRGNSLGGIYCLGASGIIQDNAIRGNSGSGIYCVGASPLIQGNTISGNSSSGYGGGIYCDQSSAPTIQNNALSGNSASRYGGGISLFGASPAIRSNTLSGNSASWGGGGIYCDHASAPTISNCIVTFSSAGGGLSVAAGAAPTVTYNDFFGNAGGEYVGLPDPTGTSGNISTDPLFADAAHGDLHEKSRGGRWDPQQKQWVVDTLESPCIDAGDPAADYGQEPPPKGGRVNLGAYGNTAQASKSAPGHNVFRVPGDYTTIQAAIDAANAGDEVAVGPGTHRETISFHGRKITVRSTDPEDPAVVAATIIDGHQAGSVVTFNHGETSQSVIEGFTLIGGTGTGGGIYCESASPTIQNNTLRGNAAGNGGGICCVSASPTIQSNTLRGNAAGYYGGAIYCESASPAIQNNTLSGNAAANQGGGICCVSASPTIRNNTLSGNSAGSGGGIYCDPSSTPTILNCIVVFSTGGGGLCVTGPPPSVTYSDFCGNTGGDYLGLPSDPTGKGGNISTDPLLVDAAHGDLHEKSRSGRWDPKQKQWVADTLESPCIDAGSPKSDCHLEPAPNGGRINMGAYGDTEQASKSSPGRNVFHVPGDCATIQAAIDQSQNGDEVVVAPGTYRRTISFNGKRITVRSTDPTNPDVVAATVLDARHTGSTVLFSRGETLRSVLDGFTITGGIGTQGDYGRCGGGIYCVSASPTIQHNTVWGNSAENGGGVYCGAGASPTIQSNTIDGNSANSAGGGIACHASSPTIAGNGVSHNSATQGGGISCDSSSPAIQNNSLAGNSARDGGGIYCVSSSSAATIAANTFSRNSAAASGGGICCDSCSPGVRSNVLTRNSATNGGGIYCSGGSASPMIQNNSLGGNAANGAGGGIYCGQSSWPTIQNCIVAFSSAGGGVVADAGATPVIAYSDVYGNTGGDYVGLPSDPTGKKGNLKANPLFADLSAGDLHEKSLGGRFDPSSGKWVVDPVHSPCIDAGNPNADYQKEPAPNGGRINMGAYGDTPFASKSAPAPPAGQLAVTAVAACAGSGVAHIAVNLASAVAVQVSVLNLAGREVAVLPPRDLPQGLSTLLWNGKSTSGTTAPAGRYLVRVTARRQDGSQAQALAGLSLAR